MTQLQLLVIQAAEIYGATGFRFLDDPRTGIRLGVPTAFLPLTSPTQLRLRWANYDGSIEPSRSFALSWVRLGEDRAMGYPFSDIIADFAHRLRVPVNSLKRFKGDSRELLISAPVLFLPWVFSLTVALSRGS